MNEKLFEKVIRVDNGNKDHKGKVQKWFLRSWGLLNKVGKIKLDIIDLE